MPRPESDAAALFLIAGVACGLLGFVVSAAGQTTSEPEAADKLHDVENAIEENTRHHAETDRQVEEMAREIAALRAQLVATAKAVQDYEEGLSAIDLQLVEMSAERETIEESLARRRGEYAAMLSAMARLSRNPPEAALLLPSPPIDVLRGAMVLRATLRPLERGIRSLSDQVTELTRLRAKIVKEQSEKTAAAKDLKEESSHLDTLMARMEEASKRAQSDSAETSQRLAKLSADAKDLKDLLVRIEAQRPKETGAQAKKPAPTVAALEAPGPRESARPFSAARGSLVLPARGRIVKRFGQTLDSGLASRGITVETRSQARVVAPYQGQVEFAGPFRGYGQLLIIAQGEGYHILLAGLSRIDCVVGQRLLAGEPVGVMGSADNGNPQLYVELRHDGEPINPLPWMAAYDEKVNG